MRRRHQAPAEEVDADILLLEAQAAQLLAELQGVVGEMGHLLGTEDWS